MKIMMSDGKEVTTTETPTYIVTPERDNVPKKGGISKKHVLIAVSVVVVIAIILAAILVGVHMFSETQKEIVKFSLQFKGSDNQNIKQDVESDPNDNVVMTKVSKNGQDAYIVDDFNKGMQIVKLVAPDGTNCYVSALNRSLAMNPGQITGPDSMTNQEGSGQETFVITDQPVADRSFLTKKALDMCKGVSLYWVTRSCAREVQNNSTETSGRNKRAPYSLASYRGLQGKCGCHVATYACSVSVVQYSWGCKSYATVGTCCGRTSYCWHVYYGYC